MRTKFFIFVIAALTIFGQYQAYASYRKPDESNIVSFQHERINESWSHETKAFAVSDNYCYPLEKYGHGPTVHFSSNKFVAMDLLEINLPVKVAVYRPASLDNNLSDVFYADLKLKKLREEYKALQERARRLLAGLEVSPVGLSSFAGIPHGPRPSGQPSMFAEKKQLMREHSNLTKQSGSNSSLHTDLRKALETTVRPLSSSLKRLSKTIKKDSDNTGAAEHLTRQYSIRLFHEETFFDRLVGKLFKVATYILSHKLEALFLLFSFILLLKLVVSARTR